MEISLSNTFLASSTRLDSSKIPPLYPKVNQCRLEIELDLDLRLELDLDIL